MSTSGARRNPDTHKYKQKVRRCLRCLKHRFLFCPFCSSNCEPLFAFSRWCMLLSILDVILHTHTHTHTHTPLCKIGKGVEYTMSYYTHTHKHTHSRSEEHTSELQSHLN